MATVAAASMALTVGIRGFAAPTQSMCDLATPDWLRLPAKMILYAATPTRSPSATPAKSGRSDARG